MVFFIKRRSFMFLDRRKLLLFWYKPHQKVIIPFPSAFLYTKRLCYLVFQVLEYFHCFCSEEGKKDVIGAKGVKVFQYLKNKIAESFGIQESGWEWNDHFLMWFIPEQQKLSSIQEHEGPPLDKKDHALIFKKKYKKTKIKNGRIIAYVKRTPLTLEEYAI